MPEPANPTARVAIYVLLTAFLAAILPSVISCTNSSQSDQLTFQITSGSMAPTFWGPSRQVQCDSCKAKWRVAAETVAVHQAVDCAICGGPVAVAEQLQPGEILSAKKLPPSHKPERFACVVFSEHFAAIQSLSKGQDQQERIDHSQASWNVKRIWGLPGESLQIREGELYLDGRLFRKSYAELRRLLVPVTQLDGHQFQERPTSWVVEVLQEPHKSSALGQFPLQLQPADVLRFHHPSEFDRSQSAVFDDYPQNLSTARNLVEVHDLVFDLELELLSGSEPQDATERLLCVEFELKYLGQLYKHRIEQTHVARDYSSGDKALVRFSVAAWDGWVAIARPAKLPGVDSSSAKPESIELTMLEPASGILHRDGPTQFQLTASATCQLRQADVFRDVYLRMDERDLANRPIDTVLVPNDQYFVLGDNLPISHDSRNGLGTISRQQMQAVLADE